MRKLFFPNNFEFIMVLHIYDFMRILFPKWVKYYNRFELKGLENLPKSGSAIIAPNHSGGWDWDNLCLMSAFDHVKTSRKDRKRIWLLYWDLWSRDIYYFARWVQRFSPIPISLTGKPLPYSLIDQVVKRGELLAIMPEGHSASIHEGYSLWRFYPGVIKLHLRYKIPIIPTACIGFVECAPIVSVKYNPNIKPPFEKEVMIPPVFPRKLLIHFGSPLSFPKYFGKDPSKEEMNLMLNRVRTEVKLLISKYR